MGHNTGPGNSEGEARAVVQTPSVCAVHIPRSSSPETSKRCRSMCWRPFKRLPLHEKMLVLSFRRKPVHMCKSLATRKRYNANIAQEFFLARWNFGSDTGAFVIWCLSVS